MQVKVALDAAVPGLPLAQAVGRLGNYFNQELYGRPTSLPWGLEIDAEHRYAIPSEWQSVDAYPTFHPTFLYELLWNLALTFVLLRVDARQVLPRGRLIAVYLLGYGIGRLWIETIKIDTVNKIFGLRINIWMAGALILAGLAMLFWPGGEPRLAEGESPYRDGHEPDTGPQDADVNSDDAADAAPQDDVSDKDGSDDASSVTADGPDS